MLYRISILLSIAILLSLLACKKAENKDPYIIEKDNGKIILAYKAFDDFLESNRSWESYKRILLDAYPEVKVVHKRQLGWGTIDTLTFPDEIKNYKREDFEHMFSQYSNETYHYLYDSIVGMAHTILKPTSEKQVDLCFFLPYGSCFVVPEENSNTIFISMWINPDDVEKIMAHEYSHVLHYSRRSDENLSLRRELVSEGMAVYLTNLIIEDIEADNSIPFMPPESFNWCAENEQLVKDSIKLDLSDTTQLLFTKYISDGSFAKPPEGFVQKSGYYIGYRIIEECVNQGMTIEEICALDSRSVISGSRYFE